MLLIIFYNVFRKYTRGFLKIVKNLTIFLEFPRIENKYNTKFYNLQLSIFTTRKKYGINNIGNFTKKKNGEVLWL